MIRAVLCDSIKFLVVFFKSGIFSGLIRFFFCEIDHLHCNQNSSVSRSLFLKTLYFRLEMVQLIRVIFINP